MAAKPRAVIVVAILAVAIAVVASVALYNYLKGKEAEVREAKESVVTEKIVVAAQEIPIGTPVEAKEVKLVDWPKVNMPTGAFLSIEAVTGRVVLQTLMEGDVLTEQKLRPTEGPAGVMTYKIPVGHRAMTVAVDQVSGVAGFITPGSMVDVVLTTQTRSSRSPISRIIFQNIPVLATGQIIETKEGEPVIVPTVTLDVTPEDAEKLATATSDGQLRLLLRRVGDTEVAMTKGATVTQVISGVRSPAKKRVKKKVAASAPVRRQPRASTVDVEVWRAKERSVESFKVKKEAAK